MRLLAGVDAGTTHVKVGLFDERGGCVAAVRQPTPRELPALVAAVTGALGECAARAGRGPDAIGIAGMAETGVPLDRAGRPLAPLLWWNDPRAAREAAELARDATALYALTGRRADPKSPLAKWLWLRAHSPEVLEAMRWWVNVPDAVAYALTGRLRTHETLGARTLAYDLEARDYAPELLARAGLRGDQLPAPAGSVEPVGPLTAQVSGVASGVPVVIAGHDHAVGSWAAGVRRPGDVADSLGTAEAVMVLSDSRPDARTGLARGITTDPSLDGRRRVVVGGLPTSGAVLDWLLTLTGNGESGYAALPGLLNGVRLPTGIVVEPYLRGRSAPAPDRGRRVTVSGLGPEHTPGDLLAAAVEGTCLHARWMLDELAAVTGTAPERLVVLGGQVRIPLWMRVKAAVSPAPVEVVRSDDAVCAGAALIAGQAGGSLDDVPVLPRDRQPPEPELAAAYVPIYERFLASARTPR
ncbi:FGGY-family carbohydrate kinase [Nonomuraea jabiensis]|uniref:Sugar (Pentulose or hexulose) kinase n=1 Tax=Nonomuraea jabiensis TaxID=882448 RepID=A0A7W9GG93_9ACTN|nr:FGGY family carbohydrate kinase [Nonomuraea jabiensis]MBB5783036.1 sugar (pentulose or hexulose) kinase [Nonomuraea jabiensis]